MTSAGIQTFDRQAPARRFNPLAVCGVAAVALLSIVLNLRVNLVTDVSWLITVIERMLEGQSLYGEVVETNPPFTIWLYYPAVTFAKAVGIAPETAILVFTYGVGLASLGISHFILQRGGLVDRQTGWWLWPAIAVIFFVLPGYAIAQREHIGLMLFLPLLSLQAWRLVENPQNPVPAAVALIAGLAGSVIVLIKPHWALAVLLPALYVAWKRRSLRQIFRLEYWVIGLMAVGYLASVLVVYPEFLSTTYPMLKLLYLPIRNASGQWPFFLAKCALPVFLWVLLRSRNKVPELADIAAAAGLGFLIAMVYLGKGWIYHLYPAIAAFLIASIVAFEAALRSGAPRGTLYPMASVWAVLVLVLLGNDFHAYRGIDRDLVSAVHDHHPNPRVAGVGGDIALGFPFTRLVNGDWQSVYNCDWIGAHALYRLQTERGRLGDGERQRLEKHLADYVPIKMAELRSGNPDVILELKSSSWNGLMRSNPAFNAFMSRYDLLAESETTLVWKRIE
ncbi:hypothetical protein [Nitratireductor sp. XY-223]|uniref:hypothetical protein n=1 Tax=Nitratireductor sp. XY-223 TaxID=2561926 RepID=UPI0010AA0244|nr:hypothetical protein [Nitratireductor sp. XY-223]